MDPSLNEYVVFRREDLERYHTDWNAWLARKDVPSKAPSLGEEVTDVMVLPADNLCGAVNEKSGAKCMLEPDHEGGIHTGKVHEVGVQWV